ncbi:hypothetical protein [Listeria fleischmannii]|uniref:hypothetical protein n=1 Tax=Listeria fleischmannii TaxID=1069827 RepID=UPI0019D4063F|nr:hypothetical protein [Listeria fleischmannii]
MAYRKTTWSLVIILFVTLFLDWFVIETKEQTGWMWLFENPFIFNAHFTSTCYADFFFNKSKS